MQPTAVGRPVRGGLTDKITQGYLPSYLRIAADLGPDAAVCEVGVYHGASLRLWQALFPLGRVTGVDSSPYADWPEGTVRVVAGQDDPGLPGKVGGPFGLVVDDASHDGTLTAATFRLLWPLVQPGGYYVVEDWWVSLAGVDGGGMLAMVAGMLSMLDGQDGECEQVTYRYGMAIAKRRGIA